MYRNSSLISCVVIVMGLILFVSCSDNTPKKTPPVEPAQTPDSISEEDQSVDELLDVSETVENTSTSNTASTQTLPSVADLFTNFLQGDNNTFDINSILNGNSNLDRIKEVFTKQNVLTESDATLLKSYFEDDQITNDELVSIRDLLSKYGIETNRTNLLEREIQDIQAWIDSHRSNIKNNLLNYGINMNTPLLDKLSNLLFKSN